MTECPPRLVGVTWRSCVGGVGMEFSTRIEGHRPRQFHRICGPGVRPRRRSGAARASREQRFVSKPRRSVIQTERTASVGEVNGTARCLRPLPSQRTFAPVPRLTSPQSSPVSSETRSPVCTPVSNSARSRRPSQRLDLGRQSARRSQVDRGTRYRACRSVGGMARTRG